MDSNLISVGKKVASSKSTVFEPEVTRSERAHPVRDDMGFKSFLGEEGERCVDPLITDSFRARRKITRVPPEERELNVQPQVVLVSVTHRYRVLIPEHICRSIHQVPFI